MAQVPEVVLDLYAGVPKDCFVSGVPFTLRGFDDNEVIPYQELHIPGPDGVAAKWVRFCDFLPFVDACKAYWMHKGKHPVYLYVMPYTPLRDALYLHDLLVDADSLPSYDSVKDLRRQEMQFDREDAAGAPQMKKGLVEVYEGCFLNFTVFNYSQLWSKAQKYCILSYVSSPLHECLHRLEECTYLLYANTSRSTSQQLVSAADDARRHLALVIMEKYTQGVIGVDPHQALLAMYPEMHDDIYTDNCQQCQSELFPVHEDVHPSRVEAAMPGLGHSDGQLSIQQAEFNLMNAEGALEFQTYNKTAHDRFFDSRDMIRKAMKPTLDHWKEATTCHCLMGVLSRFEDANPDEAN